jgi:hypothetical protein
MAKLAYEVEIKEQMEFFGCEEGALLGMNGTPRVRFARGANQAGKRCTQCRGLFTQSSFHLKGKGLKERQSYCKQCSYIAVIANKRGVAAKLRQACRETADDIREQIVGEVQADDKRVTRKTWPIDRERRFESARKIMRQALIDYDGQEAAIAAALRLPMVEVMAVIEGNEDLNSLYDEMQNYAIAKVEKQLYKLALESNSPTAGMFYLKNARPEKWADKSQVEVKNTGFAPPPADAERPASILALVQKKVGSDG